MSRDQRVIDKLALIYIRNGELLVARSRGKDIFYIPGGKRESGESDKEALIREVREELSVELKSESIQYAHNFEAQAHGKDEGVVVKTTCYYADFSGEPSPSSEIEELAWVSLEDKARCSVVTQGIIEWLVREEKVFSTTSNSVSAPVINIGGVEEYEWVVFDADNTLFHFYDFQGLQRMFSQLGITFTEANYAEYKKTNQALWEAYEQGEITAEKLANDRFEAWAVKLQTTPAALNGKFLDAMAEVCVPLDGAVELIRALSGKVKLGIITNGFTQLQQVRLERHDLARHFSFVLASEEVGKAKPHRDIFDRAHDMMERPDRAKILMVGDNPHSDIVGGIAAGMQTCWLNVEGKAIPEGVTLHAQVASLSELKAQLLSEMNLYTSNGAAGAAASESILGPQAPLVALSVTTGAAGRSSSGSAASGASCAPQSGLLLT